MTGYEDFVDLGYRPRPSDLLASFRIGVPRGESAERAAGAVAAESSVGTWTRLRGLCHPHVRRVGARVYAMEREGSAVWARIAYPLQHFERGNMPQVLASVAGNVFGMKAVASLRLQDIRWPRALRDSFPGPRFGIDGVRKAMGVPERPLLATVPKPKVGLTTAEHCEIARQIWTGGLDLLKDDENLAGQRFNPFGRRVALALRIRDRIEEATGERKDYLVNVTAPTLREMERRARLVARHGGRYAMVDILTTGWLALRSLREACGDLGLAIHAHRAFHAAFTRNPRHGMSMLAVAEIARLLGADQLHVGTAGAGKLEGAPGEVRQIQVHLAEPPHPPGERRNHRRFSRVPPNPSLHTLGEEWGAMLPVLPVASGGVHPGIAAQLLGRMGADLVLQMGGGVHGHPGGSGAGARAVRDAVDAFMEGRSPASAARSSPALRQALETWGRRRPR
ncbi:MAG: type III ribulose-bisphosphate carboxylase [Halobacteria archaeon]